MTLARSLLLLSAVVFAGVGVGFLVVPTRYAAVVDIAVPTAMARTDVRATYGGFDLAFGIFLALCAIRSQWIRPGLFALGLAAGGFAVGRLVWILVEGTASRLMLNFLAVELTSAVLAFFLLHRLARSGG